MTPTDFKARREALGLSQTDLADIWDITQRTLTRWETGASVVPTWAARLIVLEAGDVPE